MVTKVKFPIFIPPRRVKKKKIMVGRKFKDPPFVSPAIYSDAAAQRASRIDYYQAMGKDIKDYAYRQSEKRRLSTTQWGYVTNLLNFWKSVGSKKIVTGQILLRIYEVNKVAALARAPAPTHRDLISLLARPELLLLAYRKIRGNDGAFTKGSWYSEETWETMNEEARAAALHFVELPDGISLASIHFISSLIKKGIYPWGVSRRIYSEKAGTTALRPLTIPPFVDRIVQQCILMILESIYEPWFEVRNRSFGFRPNKGCHDAITALKSGNTNGLTMAVEGDIKGAFNKVDREILVGMLEKRIKDRKFIKLIRERLDYEFTQGTGEDFQRIREKEGTPQGGIESPYLWNIYMMSFDDFIHNELQDYINDLNVAHGYLPNVAKKDQKKTPLNPYGRITKGLLDSYKGQIVRARNMLRLNSLMSCPNNPLVLTKAHIVKYGKQFFKLRKQGITLPCNPIQLDALRQNLYAAVYRRRKIVHRRNFMTNVQPNRALIRLFYTRYADDWILLFNGDLQLGNKLKSLISTWLQVNLKATLSDEKTSVTDLRKQRGHFLGYEITVRKDGWLKYVKIITGKRAQGLLIRGPRALTIPRGRGVKKSEPPGPKGILRRQRTNIKISPDSERLLTRLHIRGYCDRAGFPREMKWLSCLEAFMIVERYNAVLRGLANYYNGYTSYGSSMNRWIYIIRYSCLKTLAQKYKTTIGGIFRRFRTPGDHRGKTIEIPCIIRLTPDIEYIKTWRLLTPTDLKPDTNQKERAAGLANTFLAIENRGRIGNYPLAKDGFPKVTNMGFLDEITWVNARTQASFDMPCAICGKIGDIQMHHIRHVRKRAYALIPTSATWEQVMCLRNRKQLPVCIPCHLKIHNGTFNGPNLRKLSDNRVLHVGSFVHRGYEHHAKSLEEKGWEMVSGPQPGII